METLERNKKNINLIRKIKMVNSYGNFRKLIFDSCVKDHKNDLNILDIGKSARNYSSKLEKISNQYITADINKFEGIDLVMDICDLSTIPKDFHHKFNNIVALAIMEHVWQPFLAAENLVKLLDKKKNSKIWIHAPFLFRYHAPKSLVFQDYFRYTRDSWAILFPDARKITLSPVRGPFDTALNLALPRYKNFLAKSKLKFLGKFFKLFNNLYSEDSNKLQVSGYNVIIEY